MVNIDTVINTILGGLTLDPAGMHCPSWDDAFVSSVLYDLSFYIMVYCCTVFFFKSDDWVKMCYYGDQWYVSSKINLVFI